MGSVSIWVFVSFTSSTWSCRGRSRCARPRAGTAGRGRTCGSRRASARSVGSGCRHGPCTWTCVVALRPVMSSPLLLVLVVSLLLGVALGGGLAIALGALLALLGLAHLALVGLGVLRLELLERGLLGLGPQARLLVTALLLLGGGGVLLAGTALGRERHPQQPEELVGLLVGTCAGPDRDVEAADLLDRVVVDL